MPSSQQPETLRVQRSTNATPEEAWALIADITRMGDWSPETTSAVWRGGAKRPPWEPASEARTRWARRSGTPTAP
jgi:hypothetical protein